MRRILPVLAVAVTVLTVSVQSALAAPIINTPVLPSFIMGATGLVCQALNVGKKSATVVVEIINASSGAVLATTPPDTVIEPGTVKNVADPSVNFNTYCRVTGLSAKSGRATYILYGGPNTVLMSVTAP